MATPEWIMLHNTQRTSTSVISARNIDNHGTASETATPITNDQLRTFHLFNAAWNDCTSDSTGPVQTNAFGNPLTVAARLLRQLFITWGNPSS